ncbi:hypothetical protein TUM12370_04190 [Salmonella enterica subsp. enterica serovar Choleraesuis]|nr:hypothetical protein TUM12370_04190 [Salmonella enterica subsp. enterica serovar Choleraesuis]
MNQAIQFPDREWWDDAQQAVCFPALVHGMQCTCAIRVSVLQERFGESLEPLDLFRANRWDLEEEAQHCIECQAEDSQGWFWLSSSR